MKRFLALYIKKYQSILSAVALATLGIFMYQNCGFVPQQGFSTINPASSGGDQSLASTSLDAVGEHLSADKCEEILLQEFSKQNGYYSFVKSTCAGCHNGARPDAPAFASSNLAIAWPVFKTKEIQGNGGLSARAVSNHQPGITGAQNQALIDSLQSAMGEKIKAYNVCAGISTDATPVRTNQLSLDFISDRGADLSTAEKNFLYTKTFLSYNASLKKFENQNLTLNPFQRAIYNESSGKWELLQLKKLENATIDDGQKNYTRTETYTITDALGTANVATRTMTAFERVVLGTDGKPVMLYSADGKTRLGWKIETLNYTPEKKLTVIDNKLEFSVEIKRGHKVTNTSKTIDFDILSGGAVTKSTKTVLINSVQESFDNYAVISKPTFRLLPGASSGVGYAVKKLSILINNSVNQEMTVYQILNGVICSSEKTPLMTDKNQEIYVPTQFLNTDKISFEIGDVKEVEIAKANCSPTQSELSASPTLPSVVKFSDLIGNNKDLNVFAANCTSCHGSNGSAANLNLNSFDAAKAKATTIMTRINNGSMPPNGGLSAFQKSVVQKWIDTGLQP